MSKKALQVHSTHRDQTVETEENGNSKSTKERGQFPWFVCWDRRGDSIDFCPGLAAVVSPVKNIIFLTYTFSLY
jgi:hypothetical protein